MKAIVIIPSRLGSTRLPNKPLIDLCGKTLVQRVYEGSIESKLADKVVVATDSELVVKEVERIGGEAILTPSELATGTDRVAYVANKFFPEYDIVVNVQGDEPFVKGEMIDLLIEALKDDEVPVMSTLKVKFKSIDEISNPNTPKVIVDKFGYAIYFSRSIIPFDRDKTNQFQYFKHMGYYAYKSDFLKKIDTLEKSEIEEIESLEQLRVLHNGYKIKLVETTENTIEINVPEDVIEFEKKFNNKK